MLAMYLLNAIAILIPYVTGNRELAQTLLNSLKPFWYAHLGMATGSVIGIYVGIQLLRGRQYTACVIGAILLVIPMISPCFVLAIPFAIWALILLLNKDTRAAFSEVIHSP